MLPLQLPQCVRSPAHTAGVTCSHSHDCEVRNRSLFRQITFRLRPYLIVVKRSGMGPSTYYSDSLRTDLVTAPCIFVDVCTSLAAGHCPAAYPTSLVLFSCMSIHGGGGGFPGRGLLLYEVGGWPASAY